jgi:hypothetical protein
MSVVVGQELIERILREIQAQMRTVRDELVLIRRDLADKAGRDEVLRAYENFLRVSGERLEAFEVRVEARFDQTERSIQERLEHIEQQQAEILARLPAAPPR